MKRAAVAGVLALALLASCTASRAFVATGATLTALDNTFADTAEAMNRGLDAHHVTEQQYDAWRAFALRFKALAPVAGRVFRSALASANGTDRERAQALLTALEAELMAWAVTAAGGSP